ncbi:MAG TPA: site-2 protease family protein [Candidatus Norongarragalinales archaeon]|jgi:membrane-associated protease RseP (regulator of RpoE activity)|nr:site-2 protease family protein [Candidatus Norongarragalinales archaeon]
MKNPRQAALIILASAIVFFSIAFSSLESVIKIVLMIADLVISGTLLKKVSDLEGYYGFLMLRSKKGLGLMDWIARKYPRAMTEFANAGLTVCFGLVYGFYLFRKTPLRLAAHALIVLLLFGGAWYLQQSAPETSQVTANVIALASVFFGLFALGILSLAAHAFNVLTLPSTPAGATLVIPGVTPGIPLFEGILAIAIIATVHELAHGIIFRVEKQEVKHSGALLFGFLPVGAFVEPDEKKFEKLAIDIKRRVLVAGSASNLVFFFVFLALLQAPLALALSTSDAVRLVKIDPTGTSNNILQPDMIIYSVNGVTVRNTGELSDALRGLKEGDRVTFQTSQGEKTVQLGKGGKMGIYLENYARPENQLVHKAAVFVLTTFNLTSILNLALAIINILPLFITDGHKLLQYELRERLGPKRLALANAISNTAGIATLILLIINFLPNLNGL